MHQRKKINNNHHPITSLRKYLRKKVSELRILDSKKNRFNSSN